MTARPACRVAVIGVANSLLEALRERGPHPGHRRMTGPAPGGAVRRQGASTSATAPQVSTTIAPSIGYWIRCAVRGG